MSGFSFRKPCPRTLIVVNTKTRAIFATRNEDMNQDGMAAARITKPIYDLVKSGDGIMFYAHTPHILRQAVEINGRYFAKPPGWSFGCKPGGKVPKDAVTPQVRKFYNVKEYNDGTHYVEYDGKNFVCVRRDGTRSANISWNINEVERWIKEGKLKETP